MTTPETYVGQQIYIIIQNKIAQVTVSRKTTTEALTEAGNEKPEIKTKAFASLSRLYQHEVELEDNTFYKTKEELVQWLVDSIQIEYRK